MRFVGFLGFVGFVGGVIDLFRRRRPSGAPAVGSTGIRNG
jgi:hypothetical protein